MRKGVLYARGDQLRAAHASREALSTIRTLGAKRGPQTLACTFDALSSYEASSVAYERSPASMWGDKSQLIRNGACGTLSIDLAVRTG
jgi:hypothetical protein